MSVAGKAIGDTTPARHYQPVSQVDAATGAPAGSGSTADGSQPISGGDGDTAASNANPIPTVIATGNVTDRTIATNTSSQQVVAANASRRRIMVQNQDAAINVFVKFGATATTGGGSWRVGPGLSQTFEGTTQALNIIAASGTPVVTVWEF